MKEERTEADEWVRSHDMPHEDFMDEKGVELDDLSAKTRAEIRRFDILFDRALADGFVDMEEHLRLVSESQRIRAILKQELNVEEQDNQTSSNSGMNIFSMLFCGIIGAAIGAELTKNRQT